MCQYCDGKFAEYQRTYCMTLSMGTFGKNRTLEVSACRCPPFVDCAFKNSPANSAFIINYCPNCGRKLNDSVIKAIRRRKKRWLKQVIERVLHTK